MRRLLFPLLAIMVVTSGCTFFIGGSSQLPIAYIDSIFPKESAFGEQVTFTGYGTDPDGEIVAYQWRSSIDGVLGDSAILEISSLSEGTHTVYFKVQNDGEKWSQETYRSMIVFSEYNYKPFLNSFEATPASISRGESSTLRWDVSDATNVTISPMIGDVSLTGTMAVSPASTTQYTLTASNKIGVIIAESDVMVIPRGEYTVTLYSIPAEGGHVKKNGDTGTEPNAGDTASNEAMQAFLSFDISMIPAGATVKAASLDLVTGDVIGSPFSYLGVMGVFHHQYGYLDGDDFVFCSPKLKDSPKILYGLPLELFPMTDAMYVYSLPPTESFSSSSLIRAIQSQVNKNSSRFQVRAQFEKYYYNNLVYGLYNRRHYEGEDDYISLGTSRRKLVIEYEN